MTKTLHGAEGMEQMTIAGIEPAPKATRRKRVKQATRGDYYGIKATALSRDANLKLAKIRAKIELLQGPWADSDPMIEQAVARTLAAIDELGKQFSDSAEYMNEPMED